VRGQGERRDKLSVAETALDWGTPVDTLDTKIIHLVSVGVDPVPTAYTTTGAANQFHFGTCPDPLAPGDHCDLTVRPAPSQYGPLSARIEWKDQSLACALTLTATNETLTIPQLLDAPTKESLRTVAMTSKDQLVMTGTGGVAMRLGKDGVWSQIAAPATDTFNVIATYGGDDTTRNDKTYRYQDDERDLVFAGSEGGVLFLSRNAGAFEPLPGWEGDAIVHLWTASSFIPPEGADNLYRPQVKVMRADSSQDFSFAFAPPGHLLPRITNGKVVAYTACTLGEAYVLADGSAYFAPRTGPVRKIDHPDAQGLRAVACAELPIGPKLALAGAQGTVLSSSDGTTWDHEPSGTTETLRAMTINFEGNWVAVGESGTIIYSLKGGSWKSKASPTKKTLNAVVSSGFTLVAVGDEGTVLKWMNWPSP
jgi:hypothetical protein